MANLPNIYICSTKREIAERLSVLEDQETGRSLFPDFAHLAIFAAAVAINKGLKPKKVQQNDIQIRGSIFVGSDDLDQIIDLMIIGREKDIESIDEDRAIENYKNFEGLINNGLNEIQKWVKNLETDEIGLEAIYSKLKENAPKTSKKLKPERIKKKTKK